MACLSPMSFRRLVEGTQVQETEGSCERSPGVRERKLDASLFDWKQQHERK